MPLTLNDFDYTLPAELIAQAPLAERSASRLLVVSPNADGAPMLADAAFTDLPEHWAVDLVGPRYGVRMTAASAWLQVYTGEKLGRRGVAVEPMTCPPDAFNGDHASVEVAPGGTRTLVVGIAALRP